MVVFLKWILLGSSEERVALFYWVASKFEKSRSQSYWPHQIIDRIELSHGNLQYLINTLERAP